MSSQSMGSLDPELPDTTLFLTVFFLNFQADISSLREYIKDLQLQAGISALRGERVKSLLQWLLTPTSKSLS